MRPYVQDLRMLQERLCEQLLPMLWVTSWTSNRRSSWADTGIWQPAGSQSRPRCKPFKRQRGYPRHGPSKSIMTSVLPVLALAGHVQTVQAGCTQRC